MVNTIYFILALATIVACCMYKCLYNWRLQKFKHLPQLPNSLLFGHLKLIGEYYKRLGESRLHIDYVFEQMVEDAGRPDILLADIRPVSYAILIVSSHVVAEQISKGSKLFPTSTPKSPTLHEFMRLIGHESLLSKTGELWKPLRKIFNPGFSPQHLNTLLPSIFNKSAIFIQKLDSLADTGSSFRFEPLCTNVTFDIIGQIIMNINFEAQDLQSGGHPIVYHFRKLLHTYANSGKPGSLPFWMNIPLVASRTYHSIKADEVIKQCIREKFGEIKEAQSIGIKDRSVLALALKDVDHLTGATLQSITDQVKTFLFAGHDTTSTLLQWLFYALSIHPKCLAALRAEHDAVFGDSDPEEIFLERPDETVRLLPYTSACIKEALRLWPPAGTARLAPMGSGLKVRLEDGQEICIDGVVIYVNHYLIQRDPRVYGETANDFVPERWLGDTDTSSRHKDDDSDLYATKSNKIPISAWRPFERGPRNCIGQELANLEARVILACTVRRYDFVKVGPGAPKVNEKGEPIIDEKGRCSLKSEMFNMPVITAKPFDSMMKVKLRRP